MGDLKFIIEHHHFLHDFATESFCNRQILQLLADHTNRLERIQNLMGLEKDKLAEVLADVIAQKTVADSVKALLEAQKTQLDALIAGSTNGQVTVADLQNLKEHLMENTTELTAAVVANTETPVVPVVPVVPDPIAPAPPNA